MNEEILRSRIARNVTILREHYGWTISELSDRSGVTLNLIKHLLRKRSNPSISAVLRLANAAGLSLNDIVEEEIDRRKLPDESAIVPRYRDPEGMAAAIGSRTRTYRMREKLTLRKFIQLAKISKAMLYYIETNAVEPSVEMVHRLAAGFGMSLAEFVEAGQTPVIAIGPQVRDFDDLSIEARERVDATVAPPGSTAMLYVVEGTICVSFESDRHLLERGDAIVLMTDQPYSIAGHSEEPARFLRFNHNNRHHAHDAESSR